MLIKMVRPRRMQHAGSELPLDVGEIYDLEPAVAKALIATGAAVNLEDTPEGGAPTNQERGKS